MSKRQAGYTLISTVVSFTVGGVILAGAWTAYRDMQVQLHVNNADRMMDQYAQAAIQELTNFGSWSWFAEQVQGGSRYTRWKFMTQDQMNENGTWVPWYTRDQLNFTQVGFQPNRGITFSGRVPAWSQDQNGTYYLWQGGTPRQGETRSMDRRDRMTMESMLISHSASVWPDGEVERVNGKSTLDFKITLQYRYRANSLFGLYPQQYVRERSYQTTVYQRNWGSDVNDFRKEWVKDQLGPGES